MTDSFNEVMKANKIADTTGAPTIGRDTVQKVRSGDAPRSLDASTME